MLRDALWFILAALALGILAWTYHVRQEVGQGVHFNEDDAKLATGNVLDTTVVSEATGLDTIGILTLEKLEPATP